MTLRKWAAAVCAWLVAFLRPLLAPIAVAVRALRAKLIDDVRRAWQLWSVRLTAAAAALQAWAIGWPDAALQAWTVLPAELKTLLPTHYVNVAAAVLTAAAMIARLIKQKLPANG